MVFHLDKEWYLQPLKGATNQAFMGIRGNEKVFIKRNTSPLLAALSKEGLAPKMIWTKRTVSGDILTAQEWLDGQVLAENEIGHRNDVIDVLYQLHNSHMLKKMMEKIGGEVQTPEMLIQNYVDKMPTELKHNTYLSRVIHYLVDQLPEFSIHNYMVVHGDVNHRNWMVSKNYLYLVDWDSVMIADPAVDLGMFLGHYVSQKDWNKWLLSYGIRPNEEALSRIRWYALFSFMQEILRYFQSSDMRGMNNEILKLKQLFDY